MAGRGSLATLFRWISDSLWPGDYDRDSAKASYRAYLKSKDIASLHAAIESFQLAVDQYRKYKKPALVTTLIDQSVAFWSRYEECGQSPEDLDMVVSLNTGVLHSWVNDRNTDTYVILLNTLAQAYCELYRSAFEPSFIRYDERERTFDTAVEYYTELVNNPAATSVQRTTAQIQLGNIFRTRCHEEPTLDRFDIGIQHLQNALSEAVKVGKEVNVTGKGDEAEQEGQTAVDNVRASCLFNLAKSFECRFLQLPVENPQKLEDLNIAMDYNTRAATLLHHLKHREWPACMYHLARQHWLRWMQTGDQKDYYDAIHKAIAAEAQTTDMSLQESIMELYSFLGVPSNLSIIASTSP